MAGRAEERWRVMKAGEETGVQDIFLNFFVIIFMALFVVLWLTLA